MAGTDSRFDADAFRTAIRFAMDMGAPDTTSYQATFKWSEVNTFAQADSDDNPWTWDSAAATTSAFTDVQISVAVEFRSGTERDSKIGQWNQQVAVITVLDEDFDSLTQSGTFADRVQLGTALFEIQFVEPPVGLFDVTIYTIYAKAIDEGAL